MAAYIFRLFAPAGRFRVSVAPDASLKTLYRQVAEACGLERTRITLYREEGHRRHVRHTGTVRVMDDLQNGQILYVKYGDPDAARIADDTMEEKAKQNIEPPRLPSPVVGTASAAGAKFLPFDEFIRSKTSFDVSQLPLSCSFKPFSLERGRINRVPPSATLMHQQYRHVDHVEFCNVTEVRRFVSYWTGELQALSHRAALLFGYYLDDPHYPLGIRACVEALYEPEQDCIDGSPQFDLEGEEFGMVQRIAAALGLEVIGWIFTHLKRKVLLEANEILRIARLQLRHSTTQHFTKYPVSPFVTVTCSLDENNLPQTNAFMVSDLGMALERDGALAPVQSSDKIELRAARSDELIPDILENGKSVNKFDPDWLVVRLNDTAPVNPKSFFVRSTFPIGNRLVGPQPSDLSNHVRTQEDQTSAATFADWQLLLYIGRLFDVDTAVEVATHVALGTPVEKSFAETLQMLG